MTIAKLESMERLRAAGLWDQAEAYREEVRRRLKSQGKSRSEAVDEAWVAMVELFMPLTEALQQTPALEIVLGGSIDEILDPEYTETDARKQIRDSMFWVAEEFRRIVEDRPTGTVVDFTKAHSPPPTMFAVQTAETYAARLDKRMELIAKIMTFADKSAQESRRLGSSEDGGFLDSIG